MRNCQKSKRSSGVIMLVVVIGILMVLTVLGFSLNSSVSEMVNWSSAFSTVTLMDQTALELSSSVFSSLARSLSNPDDSNYKILLSGTNSGKFTCALPLTSNLPEAMKITLSVISVSAEFTAIGSIASDTGWKDPFEKFVKISLTIELSAGHSKYRPIKKKYTFVKLAKVQRLALPLVSKFTLYVKSPELTDETNLGYNCYDNFIDGRSGQNSPVMPLVFIHSKESPSDLTFNNRGWVFLGGDKELQLHVTSGNDVETGEFFQFLNIDKPDRSPPMFTFNSLPATPVFSNGVTFLSTTVSAKVSIRGSYFGFYKWDRNEGSDMNFYGVLQRFFGSTKSRTMSSSFLHLLGNFSQPSPTIVIGKVKRVFSYYSGVLYDASGEGKSEKFLDILENPAILDSIGGQSENFWNSIPLKISFKSQNFGREYMELPPDQVAAETLFTSRDEYLKYASNIIFEPYNRSYDYFSNQTGQFPPPEKFTYVSGNAYEISGEKLKITDSKTGHQLFDADCRTFSSDSLIRDRVSLVVENQQEFNAEFLKNNVLDLKGQVIYVKTPLSIPRGVSVKNPGVLCVKGDLTVEGEIKKCPSGPLTLISKNGDIILKTVNEEVWAHLVALDGTVYPANKSPVKIFGGIAVKTLNPVGTKGWAGGGKVVYDERLDPLKIDKTKYYSVQIADYFEDFNMERMN
ncbi:MAG: hypothetical protein HQM10_18085 [Candidatus Riflebacteria bacterium]|nr:hypothetical protein [Candidatus Riflebacteria bacterium]